MKSILNRAVRRKQAKGQPVELKPLRKLADINQEYTQLCVQAGETLFKIEQHTAQLEAIKKHMQVLANEAKNLPPEAPATATTTEPAQDEVTTDAKAN